MFSNKNSLKHMLQTFSSHQNKSTLSSLGSEEPHLEASFALGNSSNRQTPDSFIGKSNLGVDPNKFLKSNIDKDEGFRMIKEKSSSLSSSLSSVVKKFSTSPLQQGITSKIETRG